MHREICQSCQTEFYETFCLSSVVSDPRGFCRVNKITIFGGHPLFSWSLVCAKKIPRYMYVCVSEGALFISRAAPGGDWHPEMSADPIFPLSQNSGLDSECPAPQRELTVTGF